MPDAGNINDRGASTIFSMTWQYQRYDRGINAENIKRNMIDTNTFVSLLILPHLVQLLPAAILIVIVVPS